MSHETVEFSFQSYLYGTSNEFFKAGSYGRNSKYMPEIKHARPLYIAVVKSSILLTLNSYFLIGEGNRNIFQGTRTIYSSLKDFNGKWEKIFGKLLICSYLLKKSHMKNLNVNVSRRYLKMIEHRFLSLF